MVVQNDEKTDQEVDTEFELVPVEVPDEDIGYALSLLKPILEATISKLYELGKPGWGSYCEVFYRGISDVMVAANEEKSE